MIEPIIVRNGDATVDLGYLPAGLYGCTLSGTFNGGSYTLQRLQPDESTWVTCATAVTAAGYFTASLIAGKYRLLETGTTSAMYIVFASITSPGSYR